MDSLRRKSYINIQHLIRNANLMVALDANMTTMVYEFFKNEKNENEDNADSFYNYRNRFQNKKGIPMTIHLSKSTYSYSKLKYISELINSDISNKKTIIIFSDSKKITIQIGNMLSARMKKKKDVIIIEKDLDLDSDNNNLNDDSNGEKDEFLLAYDEMEQVNKKRKEEKVAQINREKEEKIKSDEIEKINNYIRVINSDSGTAEEIANLNELGADCCFIISPRIVYGVDITIEYDKVYCIYNGNTNPRYMDALQIHQQYSRTRNTKEVIIFDLSPFTLWNSEDSKGDKGEKDAKNPKDKTSREIEKSIKKNKFVSYDCNKYYQTMMCNEEYKNHITLTKELNVVDELAIAFVNEGKQLYSIESFSKMHFFYTWLKRLFEHNKMQLWTQLAKDAGYEIKYVEYEVEKLENEVEEVFNDYEQTVVEVLDDLIKNGNERTEKDFNKLRMKENLAKRLDNHLNFLGITTKEITPDIRGLLLDENKFNNYVNRIYLDMDKDTHSRNKTRVANNSFAELLSKNNIYKRIDHICYLEKLLGIERYKIDDINKTNEEICEIKKTLLKEIKMLIQMRSDKNNCGKKIENIFMDKIKKIECNDHLQMFMVHCYNCISRNIFAWKTKRVITNIPKYNAMKNERSMILDNLSKEKKQIKKDIQICNKLMKKSQTEFAKIKNKKRKMDENIREENDKFMTESMQKIKYMEDENLKLALQYEKISTCKIVPERGMKYCDFVLSDKILIKTQNIDFYGCMFD